MALVPEMNEDTAGKYVAEFLAFMRRIYFGTGAALQCQPDRFHSVFLCVRNDPCDLVALRFVGLYKVIFLTEDDLVILLFAEKRFQIRSKACLLYTSDAADD